MKDIDNKPGISRRILLSLGILGTVGAVAGLGTYATFTDSTTAEHSVSPPPQCGHSSRSGIGSIGSVP